MAQDEILTKQDQEFVKEIVNSGNQTKAAKKAYKIKNDGYARVKGHKQLTKANIKNAILTIAESLPDEELVKVHKEGLKAGKRIFKNNNETGEIEDLGIEPDYATRHKYLDSAYKLKGIYAPDKNLNVSVNLDGGLTEEEKEKLLKLL